MRRFIISTKSKKKILNSSILFKLIIIVFVVAFTITSWLYLFEEEGLFSEYEEPNLSNEKDKDKKLGILNLFTSKNLNHYLKEMHKMANTKIVAEDDKIWGKIEITEKKVDDLIKEIDKNKKLKENDKDMLLPILNRWKRGDFSNCVEDHNILWKKLGGTVGRAIRLRN